jgi:hypothetical protein
MGCKGINILACSDIDSGEQVPVGILPTRGPAILFPTKCAAYA